MIRQFKQRSVSDQPCNFNINLKVLCDSSSLGYPRAVIATKASNVGRGLSLSPIPIRSHSGESFLLWVQRSPDDPGLRSLPYSKQFSSKCSKNVSKPFETIFVFMLRVRNRSTCRFILTSWEATSTPSCLKEFSFYATIGSMRK